jgi:hypothetical protein
MTPSSPLCRAVDDVAAARLAAMIVIEPFFAGFSLPDEDIAATILKDTRAAAERVGYCVEGNDAVQYTVYTHFLLLEIAARHGRTLEDAHAIHARLREAWQRYTNGRN